MNVIGFSGHLAPANDAERKRVMLEEIEVLRRLWRCEKANFRGADGKEVGVGLFTRPVQQEFYG
jgi:alkanesulfonate monooxygenase SsuD/methylene tetrahydromethanopterin reductase-like flavin-dependent oxidoreductase (luciferase family)